MKYRYHPQHLLLLFALSFTHLATAADWDEGLLWRLQSPSGQVSHLFGTIHLADPRVLQVPEVVSQALLDSHHFIMELDADGESMGQLQALMRLPDDSSLSQLTGAELFAQTREAFADYGLADHQLERLQPWAAMMMLSMPPPESGLFLDLVLLMQARQAGLSIGGLETVQEQVEVFQHLPLADQVLLLADTVQHIDTIADTNQALLELYLAHDLSGMVRLNDENMKMGDQALMQRVYERLITERNQRMLDRLQPALDRGGAFVAVGALHLPGETGLLQSLHEQGFRITRVD